MNYLASHYIQQPNMYSNMIQTGAQLGGWVWGGEGGSELVNPSFCKPFLSKQPKIGSENNMTIYPRFGSM